MAVKLRCPDCRGTFPWDLTGKGYPTDCPLCESHIGHDREDDDVVMPMMQLRGNTDRVDQVYRDMERGSEIRAQIAAEQAGVPASEMSGLKITDLRSTKHPGSIAAPPLPAHLQNMGSFGGNGAEYATAIQTGPAPNAGAHARTALQQHHGALTRGHAVSDTPALEVMQPGYRRRG